MKYTKKVFGLCVLFLFVSISTSFAGKKYAEGTVSNGGSISGKINFKGTVPEPIMEDLNKGKNVKFCVKHPDTKAGGVRPRVKVSVSDGNLKDTVVFIENIDSGKAWGDAGNANFDFRNCDVDQKVAAVRKPSKAERKTGGIVKITNHDADTLHNPHGYSVVGASRKTLFNKPLPGQGDVADVTKNLARLKKKKDKHFFLQCDQHNYMEADARVVWNPYYAISGADGIFKIDNIPAGKYKMTAWHPYVGQVTREITVSAGADSAMNYELVTK